MVVVLEREGMTRLASHGVKQKFSGLMVKKRVGVASKKRNGIMSIKELRALLEGSRICSAPKQAELVVSPVAKQG